MSSIVNLTAYADWNLSWSMRSSDQTEMEIMTKQLFLFFASL